jgi:acyl-CoA synthetase (AMP-forming)/AMP-acid ligase II/3-oxoacyl-(acyl-carrier-protein) synthase/acyl carrier protein
MGTGVTSFIDALRDQARVRGHERAFTFLENGEGEAESITFGELDRDARAWAARVQGHARAGDRALLMYPPGLDFVRAFMACLYAGVVAVPVYPPRRNRTVDRLKAVAADAGATLALTNGAVARAPERGEWGDLRVPVLVADRGHAGDPEAWRAPGLGSNDLAFLQYTSGSTGTPKGVMVTHSNLLHNCELIKVAYSHTSASVFVSWLPVFHDMGLVGMVLQPIYTGSHSVLMEPAAFLQRPVRWLRAITRYRGTTSGAPNSAYELAIRKIAPADRAALDLSSWQFAYNGAEPVRASTVRRFFETFAPSGLRLEAVQPCYGMAETTLLVSIGGVGQTPVFFTDDTGATLVSSGRVWLDERIAIVDPESGRPRAEGETGEIWISSHSVTAGYWNRPAETAAAFDARLATDPTRPYFRTGDLGFVRGDQLFVTGRLKDLIIIRGRNLYPQDVEFTAGTAHAALSPDACAAFTLPPDDDEAGEGTERLVIVCEVSRERLASLNAGAALQAVREAVAQEHEVDPAAIVLLRTLGLPKTSSGKVQRRACRDRFMAGTLETVGEWRRPVATAAPVTAGGAPSYEKVRDWLVAQIAAAAAMSERDVDFHAPFSRFGLDSQRAVVLSGDLQDWLGLPVPATIAYDFPSIDRLARRLTSTSATPDHAAPGVRLDGGDAVAIIGIGCRFPGAATPGEFWTRLLRGDDMIGAAPAGRPHAASLGAAAFLEDVEWFDAALFGVTPREAEIMDPQQRLLLEVTLQAIESAGLAGDQIAGTRTGVFIGISNLDYVRLQTGHAAATDAYAATGNALSVAANRLSYHFDLRGPSWAVDTACSSSLVAVHQACESLRRGETDLAIAGGVNLILSPELTAVFTRAGMMSASRRCRTFDAGADGYVRGEGVGVIVLARLADARRDGRPIHAIVRGSAVNQDGRSHGLTAPNGPAQEAVIREAVRAAGIAPAAIGYVEAHGTGTPLGDPIEMNALMTVLGDGRPASARCVVGSTKTNIGHLEAAAGIAGLIKTVLVLQHGTIPPHLHFDTLNPRIVLDGTPFVIPARALDWPEDASARLAGVSAFGFGGTNAHVVLEAPAVPPVERPARRFERQRYWFDESSALAVAGTRAHPLLGSRVPASANFPDTHAWERQLSFDDVSRLSGPGGGTAGAVELPHALYAEIALAAATALDPQAHRVADLRVQAPMTVRRSSPAHVRTVLDAATDGAWRCSVYNRATTDDAWMLSATATVT